MKLDVLPVARARRGRDWILGKNSIPREREDVRAAL